MGMRSIYRSIAKASMERRNVKHKNKPRFVIEDGVAKKLPSYFAENWRREAAFVLNAEFRESVVKNVIRRNVLSRRHRKVRAS